MPLHIIRQDITKMECDAIVNAANSTLLGGGCVDGAIHKAAGRELLEECKTLGGCKTGDAKITKGYHLPCKYVIHTVGPIWQGGTHNEKALLESCYTRSLMLAKEYNCETVAFPLISSGIYGYPKDQALTVAVDVISKFLFNHDMTVYIVVFDKAAYQISSALFQDVATYIDDHYTRPEEDARRLRIERARIEYSRSECLSCELSQADFETELLQQKTSIYSDAYSSTSLDDMLANIDDTFAVTLLKLIDAKGITDVECYKKANVSKQTWYKIMNDRYYKPSKQTVISFAIALELSLEETRHLLATVGCALSKSSKFDIIIEYFLLHGEYNIFTINETLFKFDQVCLGV